MVVESMKACMSSTTHQLHLRVMVVQLVHSLAWHFNHDHIRSKRNRTCVSTRHMRCACSHVVHCDGVLVGAYEVRVRWVRY